MSDVLLRIVTPLLFDLGIKELADWLLLGYLITVKAKSKGVIPFTC